MNALINKLLQAFVQDSYGTARWQAVLLRADIGEPEFEAVMRHDRATTEALTAAVASELGRPIEAVLEDVGTYLVSHPNAESIRRLLRFCGTDFVDFLHSLEDLPDRAGLVLPELRLPEIEVVDHAPDRFEINCPDRLPGFSFFLAGLVRAMADDFGALALLDHGDAPAEGRNRVAVTIVQHDYARDRGFALGAGRRAGADL